MRTTKNRIIYYINSLGSGGAERQLIYTALAAKKAGYNVSIIADYQINHYEHLLRDSAIQILYIGATSRNPIKRYLKLSQLLRDLRPRIFHSFLTPNNILGMNTSYRQKVEVRIASVRNTDASSFKGIARYSEKATSLIFNSALAARIAVSKYGVRQEKVRIVYNAIDLERFDVSATIRTAARQKSSFLRSKLMGIVVARISHQKNHLGLLEAIAILKSRGLLESTGFFFVGNNPDTDLFDLVRKKIYDKGLQHIVEYLGIREDIPEILSSCNFMILPSLYEGFPNAVMEAMATKTFVIATPTGGTPELVEDGLTGILSESPNPADLATAIERYLLMSERERQTIVDNAYNRIQMFSIENMFNKLISIYEG